MESAKDARARYQADLCSAAEKGIPHIGSISKIEGDGEFVFTYSHALLQSPPVLDIQMVPQDYSSYPSKHFFLAFACNTEIPSVISKPLDNFIGTSSGMKIHEALTFLSQSFTAAIGPSSASSLINDDEDEVMTDLDHNEEHTAFGSADDGDDFEDFEFNDDEDDVFGLASLDATTTRRVSSEKFTPLVLDRIRRDFHSVRKAGFMVGRICGFEKPTDYSILSVSARVDKLCLSDETRKAWTVNLHDFVVLLIRYNENYATFEDIIERPAEFSKLDFRLRKCSKYKPTLQQAIEAFYKQNNTTSSSSSDDPRGVDSQHNEGESDFNLLGVGESIDTFMRNEFVTLVKLRKIHGLSWDSAKSCYAAMVTGTGHKRDGRKVDSMDWMKTIQQNDGDNISDHVKLPAFIANDHLLAGGETSLPAVAVQFAMRYLVRCTDYCMVCHQKVAGNFEALKPYVCGDSLCLFQYMALGFGPSIDLELMNQPNVVDLLVSFCYSGLNNLHYRARGLREYPTGLNLQVPGILLKRFLPSIPVHQQPQGAASSPVDQNRQQTLQVTGGVLMDPMAVLLNWNQSTIEMKDDIDLGKIKEGIWVAAVSSYATSEKNGSKAMSIVHHGRIESIIGRVATLHFASRHTLPISDDMDEESWKAGIVNHTVPANLVLYDQSLDDLDTLDKAFSMTLLISTIPSVESMRAYLVGSRSRQLENWNRLTPSALKLLRWIVASNRSYIVQVNDCPAESNANMTQESRRISGVEGWIQFRFAQGSPEKEMQFQDALKSVTKPQKTILAWHGSDTSNWHSIIREGLDYKEVLNGRAHGDGVYFGRDFNTSQGYSGGDFRNPTDPRAAFWPNSALKITNAMSLNELVNKPEEFRTVNQYCLVVQHVHWIQCRYLFVRPDPGVQTASVVVTAAAAASLPAAVTLSTAQRTEAEFVQDPNYAATGPNRQPLFVPLAAIPSAQDEASEHPLSSLKKAELGHSINSGDEDREDIEFLASGNQEGTSTPKAKTPEVYLDVNQTDFRPGTLDLNTLPKLNPPSYATNQAQKTIGKEIKKMQKIQSTTPTHELGWFVDFEKITNMFHWIVELHSFDATLPLAQDMKTAGLTSIVLEIRFGRDFPLSPPFVRVIRPRFVPFINGGGGHVTAGGAMCMQLLTNSGWSPVSSLESVLLQVRMAICSLEPAARLETQHHHAQKMDYGVSEAFDAYTRAAAVHGWAVPKDLREAATDMVEVRPATSSMA